MIFSGFLVNICKVSELIIGLFFFYLSGTFLEGVGGGGPFCTQRFNNYGQELLKGGAK